ncbi:helix-turn-helix domain-containing protein [Actinopolymorpha sp. B17G11]|uniref:helix-turn-helix domain-containing protein n=1 Tax=unclassified Actinopolymorpha TaxID=2627063 RepID=UPI0032E41E1B
MERLLLTPVEAGQVLGICRSQVYVLLRTGVLRSVKIGGSRRILAESLREYVAELADAA